MRGFAFLLFLGLAGGIWAQANPALSDSAQYLSASEFFQRVLEHHPLSLKADLQPFRGDAVVREARGGFDPKAMLDLAQKYDDGTQYYRQVNGGFSIPTWFGVELKTAYEQNQGVYLNPENTTSGRGLWLAGVSLPLGKGLFIDERRAALRQAQLSREVSLAERRQMRNELLFNAGKAYWDWYKAYETLSIYQAATDLAIERFRAVQQSALLGDRPFVDTLEAGIQVQLRRLSLQQAQLDWENAGVLLSLWLWEEGLIPLELTPSLRPAPAEPATFLQLSNVFSLDTALRDHPRLNQLQLEWDRQQIERRLKAEQLKPRLDLQYNAINTPIQGDPWADYSINNYKFGLQFSMPLFLRKERGALELARIKLDEISLELNWLESRLSAQAETARNTWSVSTDMLALYSNTVRDLEELLDAERRLFSGGESSLFMINSREISFISAQVRQVELLVENHKASLAFWYALGSLGEE